MKKHVDGKMKPEKKTNYILQLLTIGCICLIFIILMISGVVFVSNDDDPNAASLKIAEAASLPPKTERSVPSISGRKAEQLYHKFIIETAKHHQVDPALIKAIIMAESGYNTRAISKRGAKGLMQLMPGTARSLGVEDSFNPHQNIAGGVQYFKYLVNRFNGSVELALAAYNAGSRNVLNYNGVPPFKATQFYIQKVLRYYHIYKKDLAEGTNNV